MWCNWKHCIERYGCKLVGEKLSFIYNCDDEDNCKASSYLEEYITLKIVIKKLEESLK